MGFMMDIQFLLGTLRISSAALPPMSFVITKSWEKVYHDCFGPHVLAADGVANLVALGHHLFGPQRVDTISLVFQDGLCIGLSVMSLCMFAMHKSVGAAVTKVLFWYNVGFGGLVLSCLFILMWVQLGVTIIDGQNNGMVVAGFIFGIGAEIYKVGYPAWKRVKRSDFQNDEKPIRRMKLVETVIVMLAAGGDWYNMYHAGYWHNSVEWHLVVLAGARTICAMLQLVLRLVGPAGVEKALSKRRETEIPAAVGIRFM